MIRAPQNPPPSTAKQSTITKRAGITRTDVLETRASSLSRPLKQEANQCNQQECRSRRLYCLPLRICIHTSNTHTLWTHLLCIRKCHPRCQIPCRAGAFPGGAIVAGRAAWNWIASGAIYRRPLASRANWESQHMISTVRPGADASLVINHKLIRALPEQPTRLPSALYTTLPK